MARPLSWKQKLLVRLAIFAGTAVLRALAWTWTTRLSAGPDLRAMGRAGECFVAALWHNRILALVTEFRHQHVTTLVSRHRDGEIIAGIASALGHRSARGSSTRGAVAGLKGLLQAAIEGQGPVAVTPDGPKGPCYVAAPGVLEVVRASGRPLYAVTWAASRAWRMPSWDRFIVPKPFARITFRFEPVPVDAAALETDEGREALRLRLEAAMRRVTREAEREAGWPDDPILWEGASSQPDSGAAVAPPRSAPVAALLEDLGPALSLTLACGALPALLAPGPRPEMRAALTLALTLACVATPALAALAGALGRVRAALAAILLPLLAGGLARFLAAPGALDDYPPTLATCALGALWPLALGLGAAGIATGARRLGASPSAAVAAGCVPALALLGSLFALGPLLSLEKDAGPHLARLIAASPVTALAGSLLEVDVLRTAPLYQLVPASSAGPFRYPPYGETLVLPAVIAALGLLLAAASPDLTRCVPADTLLSRGRSRKADEEAAR